MMENKIIFIPDVFEQAEVDLGLSNGEIWETFAACKSNEPDLFTSVIREKSAQHALIVKICAACPVSTTCLEEGYDFDDAFSVRSGLFGELLNNTYKKMRHEREKTAANLYQRQQAAAILFNLPSSTVAI